MKTLKTLIVISALSFAGNLFCQAPEGGYSLTCGGQNKEFKPIKPIMDLDKRCKDIRGNKEADKKDQKACKELDKEIEALSRGEALGPKKYHPIEIFLTLGQLYLNDIADDAAVAKQKAGKDRVEYYSIIFGREMEAYLISRNTSSEEAQKISDCLTEIRDGILAMLWGQAETAAASGVQTRQQRADQQKQEQERIEKEELDKKIENLMLDAEKFLAAKKYDKALAKAQEVKGLKADHTRALEIIAEATREIEKAKTSEVDGTWTGSIADASNVVVVVEGGKPKSLTIGGTLANKISENDFNHSDSNISITVDVEHKKLNVLVNGETVSYSLDKSN